MSRGECVAALAQHLLESRRQAADEISDVYIFCCLLHGCVFDTRRAETNVLVNSAIDIVSIVSRTVAITGDNEYAATALVINAVEPEGVGVSPDGRWVYVTSETSNSVSIIDVRTNKVVANLLVDLRPRAVAFTPDGSRAIVGVVIDSCENATDASDLVTFAVRPDVADDDVVNRYVEEAERVASEGRHPAAHGAWDAHSLGITELARLRV